MFRLSKKKLFTFVLTSCLLPHSFAENTAEEAIEKCIFNKFKQSSTDVNYQSLKNICKEELIQVDKPQRELPVFYKGLLSQKKLAFEPYVITPHKLNYVLPVSYTDNFNHTPYQLQSQGEYDEQFSDIEAKFQISFKIPLTETGVFTDNDILAFAFTLTSWWQLYNKDLSRPFRETNYRPEFFYGTPLNWEPLGGNTFFVLGFVHESNGQTQLLSRSWNRIYSKFTYAKDNYVISFTPWWRIPEGDEVSTISVSANDNPYIEDYLGHFELEFAHKWHELEYSLKGRRNFSTDNGAFEFGMTYPISKRLNAYFQYTNGYGESLIDYNHSQQTVGLGVALTNIF